LDFTADSFTLLIELERKGWIQRNITPDGSLIKIEEAGTKELHKLYSSLKFLVEKSYPPSVTLEGTSLHRLRRGRLLHYKRSIRKQFTEKLGLNPTQAPLTSN